MSAGFRIRRRARQIRRELGLPRFSRRIWVLAILLFLGLIYAGTTVMVEFFTRLGRYEQPRHYEPKDFSREELLERAETGKEKKTP